MCRLLIFKLKTRKNDDLLKGDEMRRQSMETYAETAKRKADQETAPVKKKTRQGGTQTVVYLREKMEKDSEIRKEQLELRRAELEAEKLNRQAME
jgi:hypothetical protein